MTSIDKIHEDILARHQKAQSAKFGYFFLQWIKFANNSNDLFAARGEQGETYLQYRLQLEHVEEAAAIFDTILTYWKDMEQEDRIYSYLLVDDRDGNGIWHYLAATLRNHEGRATLRMARALLSMDIDFSRRNKLGQSPLSKMLLPTPRWQSLNALIQTKHLTIENIENAISEQAKDDRKRAAVMSYLFSEDIERNQGLLSQHVLHQAVQPQADATLRAATCRLFYDYCGEKDGAPAFFKLIPISNHAMFDDLMRLVMQDTMETVRTMGAADTTTRKTYAQLYLAKRILRRDNAGEGLLFKALFAGKHTHMAKISSLMRNDELRIFTMVRGERVYKVVTVDKTSLAPNNPLLSLLLQQDVDGNTVFHHAVARGDLRALRLLTAGLAPNDLYGIMTAFPNKIGLTLMQMASDTEGAKKRLFVAAKAKVISEARAKAMVMALASTNNDVRDYLIAQIKEIEDLAKSVGRKGPLPPTYTVPTNSAKAS
jgi:hypothetical protein